MNRQPKPHKLAHHQSRIAANLDSLNAHRRSSNRLKQQSTLLKLSINAIKKIGIVTGISTLSLLGTIDLARADKVNLLNSTTTTATGAGTAGIPSITNFNIPAGRNRVILVIPMFERDHCLVASNCVLTNTAGTGLGSNYASPNLTGLNATTATPQLTARFVGAGSTIDKKNALTTTGTPAGDLRFMNQFWSPSAPNNQYSKGFFSEESYHIAIFESEIQTLLGGASSGNISLSLPDIVAPKSPGDDAIFMVFVFEGVTQTNVGIVRSGVDLTSPTLASPAAGNFTRSITAFDAGQAPTVADDGVLALGVSTVGAPTNNGGYNQMTGFTIAQNAFTTNSGGIFDATNQPSADTTEPSGFSATAQFRNGVPTLPLTMQSSAPSSISTMGGMAAVFTLLSAPSAPDVTLTKSDGGVSFTQGSNGTYTLTPKNNGTAPTTGTITIVDTLPAELTYVSATGTGWSCSYDAATRKVTCTSTTAIAANAAGNPITLTVTASSGAGTTITNTATISGGGEGTLDNTNNSASDTTSIGSAAAPDLTLSKTHNGNFTVGSPAAFTFTVNNTGTAATTGTITVTDTLPMGLSKGVTTAGYNTGNFSGTNGSIWNCSIDPTGKIITCTSSSIIAGGSSASFDLTGIQVDSTAPNPVVNTATVSGGGQTNTANDTATDSATVQTTTASCSLQSQLTNTLNLSFSAAPTLISGTASTAGAVYRYSNVATGIDALVTIEIYQGTNITAATIPQNLGASIRANPEATYQYKVVLVKSTTSIPISPRDFVVTGFDVDGTSGNTVTDFVGFVNPDGYFVNSSTLMQTNLTATGVEFTSTDPGFDDPNLGLPTYAGGAFFFKTNTFTVRGGLRNASAAANRGTSFGVQASKLSSFTSLNCQTFPRTSVVIYGNVFKDTNGNKVQDGTETAYTTAGINAVLVDSNNKVIATTPIAADGSYTFDNIPSNANYTVLITTNTATVGAAPPAILLPSGWLTSGENLSGAIDGTADSTINLAVNTANVAGANFGIKVAGANVLMVKRITAINGLTTNPNDGKSLTGFIDDGTPNNADNNPQWPSSNYLSGAINGGKIKPGDGVEYTIYYLNSGLGNAKAVRICDRLDTNLNYVSDFDASNSGKGISFTNPSGTTSYLTNTNTDSDRGEFVVSNGAIPQKCNLTGATNPSGIVVVDVANSSNLLLPGGYGYIKFKTTVK